jgi:hypothetical protein
MGWANEALIVSAIGMNFVEYRTVVSTAVAQIDVPLRPAMPRCFLDNATVILSEFANSL